jgi:hypothetical protein
VGLLAEVRRAADAIASNAASVRIQNDAIAQYAAQLPLAVARQPQLDPATHYLADRAGTLAFVLQLDAINFGSGYFPRLRKRPGLSGYFTVASSLKDEFERRGPLSAADLRALTAVDLTRMMGQDPGDADVGELMGLFARALNDLGGCVEERYGGSFEALVDAAHGSAETLAERLVDAMAFYRDTHFYKRAQLTAADLATAGVAAFDDLDRLTLFADNLVPHVLRLDGLLTFAPELLEAIEREELIPAGSPAEVEIRACAVHAVELLVAALAQMGERVTAMQLDYVLWNRGQGATYKARPRHRTRTVFY